MKPGTADFDVGQMAAEMYCLAAFRDRELGTRLLEAFLKSYRETRERGEADAAKVAVRIGAHLITMMPNAWSGEATEEQVKEQVDVAAKLIKMGAERDESGLRESIVRQLLEQ
jgi:hypothetical protein